MLVPLAIGFALGWCVRKRLGPDWAAAIVLLSVMAAAAPQFVRTATTEIQREAGMGREAVRRAAPRLIARHRNIGLVEAADSRIPAGARFGVIAVNPRTGRRASWSRSRFAQDIVWLQFELAPRIAVDGPARWTIVFGATPAEAGLTPRRAFRFHGDWLVER